MAAAQPFGLLLFNANIKPAMDRLQGATGIHRFVIFGTCSDAANAFQAALADERVIGIAMFDGFCHGSRWTPVVHLWKRFRSTPWRDLFNPRREMFLHQVRELVARDVRVYFTCSDSISGHGRYENQLGDIEIGLVEQRDHTIISLDVPKEMRAIFAASLSRVAC